MWSYSKFYYHRIRKYDFIIYTPTIILINDKILIEVHAIASSIVPQSCFGVPNGRVTLSVSGGKAPYEFSV